MMETFQDRVRPRMQELGLNPTSLATKAGLDRGTVHKLLANDQQLPHPKTLMKLARALEVSEQWLLTGDAAPEDPVSPTTPPSNSSLRGDTKAAGVTPPNMRLLPNDVPVLGTAAGSHHAGSFIMEGIIDYVRRPPALVGARNVYAVFIEGTSMEPEHNPGDLRFIHPDRPARVGDSVIIQTSKGAMENVEGTIGRLAKRTATTITLQKLNPPALIEFEIATIFAMHKVLTMNELFGM
ncbi:XRE family transcriptional regulator [Phyllobacterium phragmitis]|uniref:XRE family transcriptional regulator n=2 Tax=Phyllobacterium phragmitis TaxID=2670329 RepID=A0A2S9IP91_9HYPH|nr:XRE family transcriptional regulator [Phyllobacterium phragmitis]